MALMSAVISVPPSSGELINLPTINRLRSLSLNGVFPSSRATGGKSQGRFSQLGSSHFTRLQGHRLITAVHFSHLSCFQGVSNCTPTGASASAAKQKLRDRPVDASSQRSGFGYLKLSELLKTFPGQGNSAEVPFSKILSHVLSLGSPLAVAMLVLLAMPGAAAAQVPPEWLVEEASRNLQNEELGGGTVRERKFWEEQLQWEWDSSEVKTRNSSRPSVPVAEGTDKDWTRNGGKASEEQASNALESVKSTLPLVSHDPSAVVSPSTSSQDTPAKADIDNAGAEMGEASRKEDEAEAWRRRAQETGALRTRLRRSSPLQVPEGSLDQWTRYAGERGEAQRTPGGRGLGDAVREGAEKAGRAAMHSALPVDPLPLNLLTGAHLTHAVQDRA